jgi:hypothetical protein
MGWFDVHLHAFRIANPSTGLEEEIGIPEEDPVWECRKVLSGWEQPIARYFTSQNTKALYIYDFGDDWQHDIELEEILPRELGGAYPRCLAGKRACPLEDCGGVWGYMDLLEVLSDPTHDAYEEMTEWVEEDFDPEYFEAAEVEFDDPQDRWEFAFGEVDDYIEEEALGVAEEELFKEVTAFTGEHLHKIWGKAKNNDLADLNDEEKRYARIMQEHSDEFFNQFEFADLTYDHEYDPATETNPFLHIALHATAEVQLENRDPIEALQFYNAMLKRKCSRHDALHLISAIQVPLIFDVLKNKKPFDLGTYRYLLKKYKSRNPEKILDLLEDDPVFSENGDDF